MDNDGLKNRRGDSLKKARSGITTKDGALVALVLIFGTMALADLTVVASDTSQISSLQNSRSSSVVITTQTTTVTNGSTVNPSSLPLMNQVPTTRTLLETWYLTAEAHQDRFDPAFPVVNQGDTVTLTLIDNDTVAHDFVLGPPYNIVVNATVPGLINDLTQQTFSSNATNNTPGVVVTGTPGNVSATYSFVAKYPGVFEFVCTYHAAVGMIGYLVVLPNAGYSGSGVNPGHPSNSTVLPMVSVSMVNGAGSNASITQSYSPDPVTVVIGVNNTVTWVNNDSSPHTVTANDGSFNSQNVSPGGVFSYTFTAPGTYKYHCIYHPWMIGTVIVKAGK